VACPNGTKIIRRGKEERGPERVLSEKENQRKLTRWDRRSLEEERHLRAGECAGSGDERETGDCERGRRRDAFVAS